MIVVVVVMVITADGGDCDGYHVVGSTALISF